MPANLQLTYAEFGDSACPWLPDQTFGEQNRESIQGVMGVIADLHPELSETVDFDPVTIPPKAQRAALWKLLMGAQHGTQERSDGKLVVTPDQERLYLPHLSQIGHGEYPIMETVPINTYIEYDQALLLGGGPDANTLRIQTANRENVHAIIAQTGQRQRGIWGDPKEGSPQALIDAIGAASGTDMDELARRSPWVKAQMARTGEDWEAPFAGEDSIYRLAGEAVLFRLIDWRNYADTVNEISPLEADEPIPYTHGTETGVIPAREVALTTYYLKDGREFHVVNGKAVARPQGRPRATTASIAVEGQKYLNTPDDAALVSVGSIPHLRGGIDMAIAYLDGAPDRIRRFDLATTAVTSETASPIVTALGELMAGLKADHRQRAALRGQDPNASELLDF